MLTLLVGSSVISPDLRLTPENREEVSGGFSCHVSQIGLCPRDSKRDKAIMTPVLRLIAVAVLGITGCAVDVANRYYAPVKYPPKDPSEVAILRAAPTRPYEVIADFQSRGESPKSVAKKAAKIGADAVIIATLGGYYEIGTQWASQDNQSHTYTRIVGTAIRYKQ